MYGSDRWPHSGALWHSKLSKRSRPVIRISVKAMQSHVAVCKTWQAQGKPRLPASRSTKINTSSFPDKCCLSNKLNGSPVANQQSCSLFIRCLFIVLSLVPTLANVLTIPLTFALTCFSYSSCSRSYSLYKFNCFTSWCLPLATMYKCKVVFISCILLSLFYYYFIDIFYYIRLLFGLLLCVFFCHPVVSFCSMLFLVVLCIYPWCPLPQLPFVLCVTV